jgi:hypothetical protein
MTIIGIIFLGWPSALIGFAFLCVGIALKKKNYRIAGAIIAMGFCLFTSLYPPPIRWLSLASILGIWVSAFWKGKYPVLVQVISITPMTTLIVWLGYAVLSQ